jgi:hypothetical protein
MYIDNGPTVGTAANAKTPSCRESRIGFTRTLVVFAIVRAGAEKFMFRIH